MLRELLVQFPLHDLPCHQCGYPAKFWSAGVTLPCWCGLDSRRTPDEVRADVKWWEANRNRAVLRARQVREAEVKRAEKAKRDAADVAIEDLLDTLQKLVVR